MKLIYGVGTFCFLYMLFIAWQIQKTEKKVDKPCECGTIRYESITINRIYVFDGRKGIWAEIRKGEN